jgi:rhamnogalacturonyl hydrolase YesR
MVRTTLLACVTLCLGAGSFAYPSSAQAASTRLPSKSEVVAVMRLVADHARHKYSANVDAYWDDGVYHIGRMALYDITRSADTLAYTEAFGTYNGWILDRVTTAANGHDRLAAAQSWIAAHRVSRIADIADTRAEIAAQTSPSLATVTSVAYFSVDSQFMALPAFAMLGRLDGESRYFVRLHELFDHTKNTLGLYDSAARLYYRDASFIYPARQTPGGKKVFWSRGNGWALAALARVLRELPANDSARAEYVVTLKELSAAIKAVQRPDGFWNMSLADPNHHPGPETSGTALFVYGMAWGINNGLLSRSAYQPVVARGWNAMVTTAVHPDGKLGYVQGIGLAPVPVTNVTYESTADFGVGAFLLAGSEVAKLAVDGQKYEVERLTTTVSLDDSHQDAGDHWASGGRYSHGVLDAPGDYIQYSAWLSSPGTYNVKIRFGRGADLGRWQLYTAGAKVGAPLDAYSDGFTFAEVNLGNVSYSTAGKKVFRFAVVGKNGASIGYATAIDYVMLTRQ